MGWCGLYCGLRIFVLCMFDLCGCIEYGARCIVSLVLCKDALYLSILSCAFVLCSVVLCIVNVVVLYYSIVVLFRFISCLCIVCGVLCIVSCAMWFELVVLRSVSRWAYCCIVNVDCVLCTLYRGLL